MISDDSISGFQFRYDIDTIFWKYRYIDIDILKMISTRYVNLIQAQEQDERSARQFAFRR